MILFFTYTSLPEVKLIDFCIQFLNSSTLALIIYLCDKIKNILQMDAIDANICSLLIFSF